jgi:hypothetical protein
MDILAIKPDMYLYDVYLDIGDEHELHYTIRTQKPRRPTRGQILNTFGKHIEDIALANEWSSDKITSITCSRVRIIPLIELKGSPPRVREKTIRKAIKKALKKALP